MSRLLQLARLIRHAPGLRRIHPLWRGLRPVYHRLIDPCDRGVRIRVGPETFVRIPAAFTGAIDDWAAYEPECTGIVARWAEAHPTGVLLDLGSAIGFFAAIALQHGPQVRVVAADADLASLACTRRFVNRDAGRLALLWGLLCEHQTTAASWDEVLRHTDRLVASCHSKVGLGSNRYVCLDDPGAAKLPHYSLDGLDAVAALPPAPLFVKCDVEGAELLVLQGAARLLASRRPTLLLSVHPEALTKHGHSVRDVAAFLVAHGYEWRLVARDHEEHWLAVPAEKST